MLSEDLMLIFFILIIIVIFLVVAILFSFIPGECIPVGVTEHIRDKHIYYENIDTINMSPSIEPINFKLLSNKKGEVNNIFSQILFITGNIELGKQLVDNCLIEFTNNNIYNIMLDDSDKITIYIWNNSSSIKGIKTKNKMITLKPKMFICLEFIDKNWSINDISLFEENREIYNKYIVKRCYNILNSEINLLEEYCYNLSDEYNRKLKNINNKTESSTLFLEILSELKKLSNIFIRINGYSLLERLKEIKGCIFNDCDFLTDDDLIYDINSMIKETVNDYNETIKEIIKIVEFTNNNSKNY